MKNKKVIIIALVAIIIIWAIVGIIVYRKSTKEKPEDTLNAYISLINEQKYEEIYNMISNESKGQISKEDFITRNKNIYEGIDAVNINIEITETAKEKGVHKITYSENMSKTEDWGRNLTAGVSGGSVYGCQ